MTPTEVWAVILGGMAVTYTTRLSFLLLSHPERLPNFFGRGLRLVAPAALAAILVPQVVVLETGQAEFFGPRPLAAVIAALIGWRTRNAWLAIGAGMIALWVLQTLFPA